MHIILKLKFYSILKAFKTSYALFQQDIAFYPVDIDNNYPGYIANPNPIGNRPTLEMVGPISFLSLLLGLIGAHIPNHNPNHLPIPNSLCHPKSQSPMTLHCKNKIQKSLKSNADKHCSGLFISIQNKIHKKIIIDFKYKHCNLYTKNDSMKTENKR